MTQTVSPATKAIAGITAAWAENDGTAFASVFTEGERWRLAADHNTSA